MRDDKPINFVNVYARIPEPVEEALRLACAKLRKSKPNAIAEAITAWVGGASMPNSGSPGPTKDRHGEIGVFADDSELSSVGGNLKPEELKWIKRMLRVLRSRKPGLGIALKANMVQFNDSAEQWAAHEHLEISGGGGSQQQRPGSIDEAIDALENLARDVAGELARLHADDAERRKGKRRNARKAV